MGKQMEHEMDTWGLWGYAELRDFFLLDSA